MNNIEIISEIHRSGKSSISKVKKIDEDKIYVCKILPLDEFRFLNEINMFSFLQHPNILNMKEFWIENKDEENEKYLYILLPLCDYNLVEYLNKKILNESEKLTLIIKIIKAIDYIHSKGLYHGDIKPANILMMGDEPLLTDFGLSGVIGNSLSGYFVSTSYNCSPQCIEMKPFQTLAREFNLEIFYEKSNPVQNDIFSLGNVIYYILMNGKYLIPIPDKEIEYEDIWDDYSNYIKNYKTIIKECKNEKLADILIEMLEPSQKDRLLDLSKVTKFFKCEREDKNNKILNKKEIFSNLNKRCKNIQIPLKKMNLISNYLKFFATQLFCNDIEEYSFFIYDNGGEEKDITEDLIQILYHLEGKILE